MKTIQVNDLKDVTAVDNQEAMVEKADAVMGGATLRSTGKSEKQYYTYELENVLISSYQTG